MNTEQTTDCLPELSPREADAHKGDFGRALLVGGSRGMAGAIALAGMAALRGGAGLVKLATADVCLETVAGFEPSYMTAALPCDQAGRISLAARDKIEELAESATCIACGPGSGRSESLDELVGWMYETLQQPMVLDADALNALAMRAGKLSGAVGPRILTPHPGEFRRLVGDESLAVEQMRASAIAMAAENEVVLVLKGHRSLITDGKRAIENSTGNPGMATGGSGDVLTGIITALVCQGLSPLDAAQLGAYLHGLAGDLAADELGQVSLTASDVIDFLPEAFEAIGD